MGMRTWIDSLAAFGLTVQGIKHSYDLNEIPDKISAVQLPCLIPIPELGKDKQGFSTRSMLGNAPLVYFEVVHRLLYKPIANQTLKQVLPELITMKDAYDTAAIAQKMLLYSTTPAYYTMMEYSMDIGPMEWNELECHGIDIFYKVSTNI